MNTNNAKCERCWDMGSILFALSDDMQQFAMACPLCVPGLPDHELNSKRPMRVVCAAPDKAENHEFYSYPDDIARIVLAALRYHLFLDPEEAAAAWGAHSSSWDAGWLYVDCESEAEIVARIIPFLKPVPKRA